MSNIFPTNTVNSSLRMHNKGNYWFFHKETFPHDFPLKYNELIKSSSNYIEIFDPYFNVSGCKRDHDIFNDVNNNITLKVLTSKGLDRHRTYLIDVKNAMKTKIPSSKNIRFGMRVINKMEMSEKGFTYHDRFLIIDQTDVYLIGSSIGHHLSPQQSTGIYKVDNTDTKEFIKEIFDEYWRKAMNNEIPLQFL